MLVEYSTNNSGGSFWLTEKEWKNLEDHGWKLFNHDDHIYESGNYKYDEHGLPMRKEPRAKDSIFKQYAHYAFKHFPSVEDAEREFEELTEQHVNDEGCECCGKPHYFHEVRK